MSNSQKVRVREEFGLSYKNSTLTKVITYIASSLLNIRLHAGCIVTSKYKCLLDNCEWNIFYIATMLFPCADTCTPSVPIFMHVSAYSCNCRYTAVSSYPGMLQAANGSFKTTNMIPLTQGDLCPPDCRKIVAMYGAVVVLFALKRNRHNTFLACRNCRRDRTRVYLDNTVVTVVNCCQLVATRFFFMFPFGREHYFDDSYNTFATVTTIWKPGLIG